MSDRDRVERALDSEARRFLGTTGVVVVGIEVVVLVAIWLVQQYFG